MLLRTSSPSIAFSLSTAIVDNVNKFPFSSSSVSFLSQRRITNGFVMSASQNESNNNPISPVTDIVFQPFEEVKDELQLLSDLPQGSLARQKFSDDVEYSLSYVYHAMYAYFDRDYVALKGFARFFKETSAQKREHAELLMEYQNKRGGRVILRSIIMPISEFDHRDKGEALYAMELALSLEKLTNEKLLNLHSVADKYNDVQFAEFVESTFITEQVEAIKKVSEIVNSNHFNNFLNSWVKPVLVIKVFSIGEIAGVWHFNQMLLDA
ncbi:hypothetical protein MKW92_029402 [Papaver armeniacum]|nr:hypothetical protein MKW92_029402 [Papaver armeniacum]